MNSPAATMSAEPRFRGSHPDPDMANEAQPSDLSPELVAQLYRLESIFMPHDRKRRDEIYPLESAFELSQTPIPFVHYTSAEAALSIIRGKRIWMRNTTCMADYREVQHGFDILRKFFSDKAKTDAFVAALDICVPGAAMEAINLFNHWWQHIQLNTYIASISEHDPKENLHGRLSMWRAFGGNIARVALVVKIPWSTDSVAALNLLFSPVSYLTEEEAHAVIGQVMKNIETNGEFLRSIDHQIIVQTVFYMLLAAVTCLKHEGFREEREWRAIYCPKFRPSPLMESSIEVIAGVPQLVCKLPLDKSVSPSLTDLDIGHIFDRLIIGPTPYAWAMYEAFVDALTKIGVVGAEKRVVVSGIPIRS
jgi:hypothetical protein